MSAVAASAPTNSHKSSFYSSLHGWIARHPARAYLNTHHVSSFYHHLLAQEAFALSQRFEFYYTPKSAGWLNQIPEFTK